MSILLKYVGIFQGRKKLHSKPVWFVGVGGDPKEHCRGEWLTPTEAIRLAHKLLNACEKIEKKKAKK